jgi:putative phosphoribosyl transferase
MFKDRTEAGVLLAAKLNKYKNDTGIILAVPRGGIPVAYVVAREFDFPLEVILTKKLTHPIHKEYAIGAASLTDHFIVPHKEVTKQYIQQELKAVRTRLGEMQRKFMGDKQPENIEGKTVIVIDDGMATGNTVLNTIQVLRKGKPAKLIVAVPVSSKSAVYKLSKEADEVITVMIPDQFHGLAAFYNNFHEVSDDEVLFYLEKMNRLRKAG